MDRNADDSLIQNEASKAINHDMAWPVKVRFIGGAQDQHWGGIFAEVQ